MCVMILQSQLQDRYRIVYHGSMGGFQRLCHGVKPPPRTRESSPLSIEKTKIAVSLCAGVLAAKMRSACYGAILRLRDGTGPIARLSTSDELSQVPSLLYVPRLSQAQSIVHRAHACLKHSESN